MTAIHTVERRFGSHGTAGQSTAGCGLPQPPAGVR